MKYRVDVQVGNLAVLSVHVDAKSFDEARHLAEALVRLARVEAVGVWAEDC